jgi:hypothetical protein
MDSATWSAVGTWVTAAIYVAILAYAVVQVGEAKKLRRAQTRPFIVVDLEPGYLIFLTVENIGSTVARDVTFSFSPPLVSTLSKPWQFEESVLLSEGIESVPPRRRHRIIFDSAIERLNEEGLPKQHVATVMYADEDGIKYKDRYTLDLGAMAHTSPDEKGLPEMVTEVSNIRKELKKWTDGNRGILVHTRDKDEMIARDRAQFEARRAAIEASRGEAGRPPESTSQPE